MSMNGSKTFNPNIWSKHITENLIRAGFNPMAIRIEIDIPKNLVGEDMSPANKQLESYLLLRGFQKGRGRVAIINNKTALQYEYFPNQESVNYEWKIKSFGVKLHMEPWR